ncbi:hypothetical protein [Selenomonas sp. KH1T6]|uniref:hypothetical protein n=1 Tax=Selenomonas sp. KH1T6 TaxID=3158784 RepID=UPI0008A7D96C|nr:hypothetical protein SAMN05216583_10390 [Selenomonas ruminantium]
MKNDAMGIPMNDMDLEMVAGGGTYYMLRYKKRPDGRYDANCITFEGDLDKWNAFVKGTPASKLQARIRPKISRGIDPKYIQQYVERHRQRGYVIQEITNGEL